MTCPHCHHPLSHQARFCGGCGNAVTAVSAAEADEDGFSIVPSFARPAEGLVPAFAVPSGPSEPPRGALGPLEPVVEGKEPSLKPWADRQRFYLALIAKFLLAAAVVFGLAAFDLTLSILDSRLGGYLVIAWFFGLIVLVGGLGTTSKAPLGRVAGYTAQALGALGFIVAFLAETDAGLLSGHFGLIELFLVAIVVGLAGAFCAWMLSDGFDLVSQGPAGVATLVTVVATVFAAANTSLLIHQAVSAAEALSKLEIVDSSPAVAGQAPLSAEPAGPFLTGTPFDELASYFDLAQLELQLRLLWVMLTVMFFGSVLRHVYLRMARVEARRIRL